MRDGLRSQRGARWTSDTFCGTVAIVIILEFRLKGTSGQYRALDEAIRTTQFIRNKCVRLWQDIWGTTGDDLNRYCRILAQEHAFVRKLNSMARQAAAERAWAAITRFYRNCKK